MPKLLLFVIVASAIGLIASVSALVVLSQQRSAPSGGSPMTIMGQSSDPAVPNPGFEGLNVPKFTLVNQDGSPLTESHFDGKVTIVDFMFTHCPFVCPGLTAAMIDMSNRLKGTPVQFVSFSVDPVNDTPARLKEYATGLSVDESRWHFLTGEKAEIDRVLLSTLAFQTRDEPERKITLPDGREMDNILHPSQLALIGPNREVLGLYKFQVPEQLQDLEKRARALVTR